MAKGWPGPGAALSQPCHLPRELSPSWESSSSSPSCLWHGAGRLEHPRPLLILIPPGPCISQSRTTVENRARAWFGTPGMETPVGIPRGWCQPWLGAGAAGPSLCPGPWLHPALGSLSPAEPKPQQNPRSLLPHLAQRGHQEPLTGTTHIPRPPWLISPALGSRAKGFLHPPLSPDSQRGFGDQISSPTSPAEPEKPLPRAVPAWPGCPQPPFGAWFGLLWQPLPKPRCQRLPRSRLCPPVPHCSYLFLAAPRAPQGRDDAGGPVCCRLDE